METSIYISQIFGVFFLIVGVGIIFNLVHYTTVTGALTKDPVQMYMWGIINVLVGFLIIHAHNVWVQDWTVMITLIGWISLIKGTCFLIFPDTTKKINRSILKMNGIMMLGGFITLLLGVFFSYYGFMMS